MKISRYILAIAIVLIMSSACAGNVNNSASRTPDAQDNAGTSYQLERSEESREVPREAGEGATEYSVQDSQSYDSADETEEDSEGSDEDTSGGSDSGGSGGTDSGSASDASSGMIPGGWPEYIPIMEGFSVRYAGSDEAGMQVVAMGDISSAEVEEFYRNLPEWETEPPRVAPRAQTGPGGEAAEDAISFQLTREQEILTVNIVLGQEKTILQLMYTKL